VSKARLVIAAVVVQGRPVAEVAAAYGVHRSWVYRLLARYRAEGDAAFVPRSRRPRTSPTAVPAGVVDNVLAERDRLTRSGHDAGPETITWHLSQRGIDVSRASAARILSRHGRVVPQPKKKPKSAYIRFQADQPNETWQSDFTHYRLTGQADAASTDDAAGTAGIGAPVEIITWLDDHSRFVLHSSAHRAVTGRTVVATFRATVAEYGCPASTLTDNGMVYTVRHASTRVRGGRNAFEAELAALGVVQKNSRPSHPTTCGKVERFQQTLKAWLTRQPDQPATLTDLQHLIDQFIHQYNHERPHRSLDRRTPAAAYQSRPKATPSSEPPDRTHTRVRTDRVNNGKITLRHAGTLYSIGIGRSWSGQPVTLLVNGLHITVIHARTGELIRQLTLDPTRRHQPQNPKQGEP
jgi:transposase InsO family protein